MKYVNLKAEEIMETYQKIMIAVDGSPYSLRAAKRGFELAYRLDAQVALVYVIDSSRDVGNPDTGITSEQLAAVIKREVTGTLDQLEKSYLGKGLKRFTPEGYPIYKQIIQQAEVWQADLIVMGTHGRTGLDHLLMGSVAEHVMRNSEIPVFVVPLRSE